MRQNVLHVGHFGAFAVLVRYLQYIKRRLGAMLQAARNRLNNNKLNNRRL